MSRPTAQLPSTFKLSFHAAVSERKKQHRNKNIFKNSQNFTEIYQLREKHKAADSAVSV